MQINFFQHPAAITSLLRNFCRNISMRSNTKTTLVMKLTGIFLLMAVLQVSARTTAQTVTYSGEKVSLKKVFTAIEKQTGYVFFYRSEDLKEAKTVTISFKATPMETALQETFKYQPLKYSVQGNTIFITKAAAPAIPATDDRFIEKAPANIDVSGRVANENGEPLQGATVKIKGSTISTVTNNQGRFTLNNVPEQAVLVISYVGYHDKEIAARPNTGLILLTAIDNTLENVVITGYTTYAKKLSTNASSVVTAEKINQVPGLTLDQILQGRVPGMSVISSSGQPGQSAATVIRGIGSINGSSTPLYILDGIPIEPGYFQTINPEDIESATVLKDASAKALYGSRGSNGVIVFTTKKGSQSRFTLNYNSQYGITDLSRPNFEMTNAVQRLQFEEEIGLNYNRNLGPGWTYSPLNPNYINGTQAFKDRANFIIDSLKSIDTDWRDFFFRRGTLMEQQVSISGGNEKIRFYNSLNYYKQEGVARRTSLDRFALRSNVDFKDNKFSGSVNLSLGYSKSSFTEGEGGTGVGTAMASVYYALPYEYPYAPDGTLIHPGNRAQYGVLDLREGSQGLERLLNSSDKTEQFKSIIASSFAYQLFPSLKIFTRAGIDYRNSTDENFINPNSYYGSRSNTTTRGGRGRYYEASRRNFNIITTTGTTFSKVVNDKNDIEVSAFYEYLYNNYNSFGFYGYGIDERLPETPAGVTNGNLTFIPTIDGSKSRSAMASFIGTARYTFDDKYTVNASYRYDGSTKVAQKNRWHGFYSIGANWNVKAEEFLKNVSLINVLSLRASYGTTASPVGGDFSYLPTYSVSTSYGGVTGIRPVSAGNDNYDWEYVKEFNIGMDAGFLQSSRFKLSVDYYERTTYNMYINQVPSVTSGFSSLSLSTGRMRNKGVEFELNADVIRTNNFKWTVGANAGYNKNKILYLSDIADEYADGDTRILKVGLPYGTYYAPKWAGVNPQTGDAQYYEKDGTITTTYNVNTQSVPLDASLYPKFTGGFNSGFSYKGLTATAFFTFVSDVMRWNNEDFYNENQRYATSNQTVRMLEDRWKKPGDIAILQRFDIPRNYTSKDIQDASFLRLRNVLVSYVVPKNITSQLKVITGVKVFVQAQNLHTWTSWRGLDPENNQVYGRFQYPNSRTYTAGININF